MIPLKKTLLVKWSKSNQCFVRSQAIYQLKQIGIISGFFFNIFVKTQLRQNSQNYKTQPNFSPKLKIFSQNSDFRQQSRQKYSFLMSSAQFFTLYNRYFGLKRENWDQFMVWIRLIESRLSKLKSEMSKLKFSNSKLNFPATHVASSAA